MDIISGLSLKRDVVCLPAYFQIIQLRKANHERSEDELRSDTIDNKRIWRKYKRKEHTRDYWEQLRWCGKEGGLYANIVEASRAIFVRLTEIQLICRVIDKILFHAMSLAQP